MNTLPNTFLLKAESNFETEITFASGTKLYRYPGFDPSNYTTLVARVAVLPTNYDGYLGVGIEVMCRYDIFSTASAQPDQDSTRYENEIWIDGESYWRAKKEQLIAVRARLLDTHNVLPVGFKKEWWVMLNDLVWMDPVFKTDVNPWSPFNGRRIQVIGNGISRYGMVPGQRVYFDPRYVQVYQINRNVYPEAFNENEKLQDTKHFYIIKKKYIYASQTEPDRQSELAKGIA